MSINCVGEVLEKVSKSTKYKQRVAILRENDNMVLRTMLRWMYTDIECFLPPTEPPYTPSDAVDAQGMLYSEWKKVRLSFRGEGYPSPEELEEVARKQGTDPKTEVRRYQLIREKKFIEVLENVDPQDALLLIKIIKREKIKNITEKLIKEAFPDVDWF